MSRVLLGVAVCSVFLHAASAYEFAEGSTWREGDTCYDNGRAGTCSRIPRCHVFTSRGPWWHLKVCGYDGDYSVICCPARATTTSTTTTTTSTTTSTTARPVATTPPQGRTTTQYMPTENSYEAIYDWDDKCPNISSSLTTTPIGRKAYDKCIEYQEQLVYPCEVSSSLLGNSVRADQCRHKADALIVGGRDAAENEFPHMVLLGFGRSAGEAQWQCGGSLISERFILTAAHCTRLKRDRVSYAIVGSLRRTDDVEPWQVVPVRRIIKHPAFNAVTKKNDIALLKTDLIRLGLSAVPACLDVFGGDRSRVVATGWGRTADMGREADTLQKVNLTEFTDGECSYYYPGKQGSTYDRTTQSCYGDYDRRADTCRGDSGGPLTIKNHLIHCMYTVVGITSVGFNCGSPGQPAWYTRVSHFVPWIESIVWP